MLLGVVGANQKGSKRGLFQEEWLKHVCRLGKSRTLTRTFESLCGFLGKCVEGGLRTLKTTAPPQLTLRRPGHCRHFRQVFPPRFSGEVTWSCRRADEFHELGGGGRGFSRCLRPRVWAGSTLPSSRDTPQRSRRCRPCRHVEHPAPNKGSPFGEELFVVSPVGFKGNLSSKYFPRGLEANGGGSSTTGLVNR